jgi:hypothetical protein
MNIEQIKKVIEAKREKTRGTYNKALHNYALELLENIKDNYNTTEEAKEDLKQLDKRQIEKLALNGAMCWSEYSWGGSSLCYDYDILENLFCPSIVKKYENASYIRGVHLLDYQAKALARGFTILYNTIKNS